MMVEQFVASAQQYIHTNPWLAVVAVFAGGVLTAASPCVLAMIPLMMSFVAAGKPGKGGVWRAFGHSLAFVAGLCVTFTVLGMLAALAGVMYGQVPSFWSWIVAAVCLVMGGHLMGLYEVKFPMPFEVKPRVRGVLGAVILGLLFGVVSAPCAAPILVVLLTYLAGSSASVLYGGLLLLVYALGHSVLILVAGTSMGLAQKILESQRATQVFTTLRRVAGGVIVVVGGYFLYRSVA